MAKHMNMVGGLFGVGPWARPPWNPALREAPSINLNSWRTGHIRLGAASLPGSPTKLSDLWKVPTPEGNSISDPFRPEELAAALRPLKPGKFQGLDSIFPEFMLHAGSALKFWFFDFLTSCTTQLKIPKIRRRALIVTIPKP